MKHALYPMPSGSMTQIIDHYEKTIRWVLNTETGEVPCDPPPGWSLPHGFVLSVETER